MFRNRSFPKAFRGIHDSVEQPTGGPGVRRARPACPGTGAGARASAGPPRRLAPTLPGLPGEGPLQPGGAGDQDWGRGGRLLGWERP